MTQEEKAKAYDEAIRKAAALYKASEPMSGCNVVLETLFPELKESEDDKIRNHIRRAISVALDYSYFDKETANNCLAWLEKQDKSSSEVRYWTEEEIEPIISDYLRGAEHYGGMIGRLRCLKPKCLEEQGEQKLIDYNEELKKCRKNPLYFFDKYVKLKEQNPAWSEEEERYIRQLESMVKERWALAEKAQDEEVIKNMSNLAFFLKTLNPNKKPTDEEMKTLLRTEYEKGRADAIAEMQKEWSEEDEENFCSVYLDVKSARQNTVNSLSGELKEQEQKRMDEVISWLKSLKGRVQPKQEWSEEDEKMLKNVMSSINHESVMEGLKSRGISYSIDSSEHLMKNLIDWLKSFRPQNRWMPSEEQMELLSEVQNALLGKDCHNRFTDFMWELKKLKEEKV